ncbi:MAG: lipid-A-disaccharide synthase [Puniceicoccales bacterium]|jgi:lipid-A-disaccharide synthase|nr:lipid-A-disaccharide synthase [Puniceicoccales bacterium]
MAKIVFNEISTASPDLLIIAGEHSGDEHGARLVRRLKAIHPHHHICAIGGNRLKETDVDFLFNLVEFSVVGIVEVLRNIHFFSRILKIICHWVECYQPKAICFIDFPGLNLRVARELFRRKVSHKAGGKVKLYHYISPQIWAWKAKRRFMIAKYIDALGVIFPFEKECYGDTDLDVQFLGHPFVAEDYALPVIYDSDGPVLLLPGSRDAAVSRIFPTMLQTVRRLRKSGDGREVVVIYPDEEILATLRRIGKSYGDIAPTFIPSGTVTVRVSAALMSSGTMALNCALGGIPSIIIYRANVLTYGLARALIRVKFLHIANILLQRESAPEFVQFAAKPKLICRALREALNDPAVRLRAEKDGEELRQILSSDPQNDIVTWIQRALT